MILIAFGSNLESHFGAPVDTVLASYNALEACNVRLIDKSGFWQSAPVPVSSQPWFVNSVVRVETDMPPLELMQTLLKIELEFGRRRDVRWGARTLDLDLIDYDGMVMPGDDLTLPHPRLHERAFVLFPLREVAPDWRHPATGASVDELAERLPPGQAINRLTNFQDLGR